MSDDDGPRRPGRPAPRYGEYADSGDGTGTGGSGLSEADARIVAEAAAYRAAAEKASGTAPAGKPAKKPAKSGAPQTLAEQMAEERRVTRERQQAERRDAEKTAADTKRDADRTAAADRRATRRAPVAARADAQPGEAGTARPSYLAGQEPRRAPKRFDAAITIGLLAAGLVNVAGSVGANADPSQAINQSYALFGGGTYTVTPQTSTIGIAVNVVNVIVFVLAAWISLELVKRKRLAFWVPIAGAVVATVITSILVLTLILQDPAFQQIMSARGT